MGPSPTFSTSSISTGRFSSGGFAIAAGRINNSHNYVDLAVSSADSDSVSVLFGNNDGTFQSPPFVIQSGLSPGRRAWPSASSMVTPSRTSR